MCRPLILMSFAAFTDTPAFPLLTQPSEAQTTLPNIIHVSQLRITYLKPQSYSAMRLPHLLVFKVIKVIVLSTSLCMCAKQSLKKHPVNIKVICTVIYPALQYSAAFHCVPLSVLINLPVVHSSTSIVIIVFKPNCDSSSILMPEVVSNEVKLLRYCT